MNTAERVSHGLSAGLKPHIAMVLIAGILITAHSSSGISSDLAGYTEQYFHTAVMYPFNNADVPALFARKSLEGWAEIDVLTAIEKRSFYMLPKLIEPCDADAAGAFRKREYRSPRRTVIVNRDSGICIVISYKLHDGDEVPAVKRTYHFRSIVDTVTYEYKNGSDVSAASSVFGTLHFHADEMVQ
ncbi:MAG: hypothetical protein HZC28_12775 [Spirochaetes bacterium]|nr:hypothetical protein [Spirochaetota bacterium]